MNPLKCQFLQLGSGKSVSDDSKVDASANAKLDMLGNQYVLLNFGLGTYCT